MSIKNTWKATCHPNTHIGPPCHPWHKSKINHAPLPVADYPVGLESRLLEVTKLLDVESDDGVYMIGIHGIGGIGKTTLAIAVYNLIACHFDGSCFLKDLREKSNKQELQYLQIILLWEILGEKETNKRGSHHNARD